MIYDGTQDNILQEAHAELVRIHITHLLCSPCRVYLHSMRNVIERLNRRMSGLRPTTMKVKVGSLRLFYKDHS